MKVLITFLLACTLHAIHAQSPSLKSTATSVQLRLTHPLSDWSSTPITDNHIRGHTIGLRWAIGVGSAWEISGQLSATAYRDFQGKKIRRWATASRLRYFHGKEIWSFQFPSFQAVTLFGNLRKRSGASAFSFYTLHKWNKNTKVLAAGTIHRINPAFALTSDISITRKIVNDTSSDELINQRIQTKIKAALGVIYFL